MARPASVPSTVVSQAAGPKSAGPLDAPAIAATPSRGTPTVAPTQSPATATTPRASPGLAEEIAAIDRARSALTDGDPTRSLRLIDRYEQRFRNGAFVEEAEVLRIEAHLRRGERTAASRVGARFLAAHPSSLHAARVRALLGQGD
jgi:hypothetical protein